MRKSITGLLLILVLICSDTVTAFALSDTDKTQQVVQTTEQTESSEDTAKKQTEEEKETESETGQNQNDDAAASTDENVGNDKTQESEIVTDEPAAKDSAIGAGNSEDEQAASQSEDIQAASLESETQLNISGIYVMDQNSYIAAGAVYSSNAEKVEFKWQYYDLTTKSWYLLKDWNSSNWYSWRPAPGAYWLYVEARTDDGAIASKCEGMQIGKDYRPYLNISGIYQQTGTDRIAAGAVYKSSDAAQFKWQYYDLSNYTWHAASDWSESNWLAWKPKKGSYWLYVEAKNAGGATANYCVGVVVSHNYEVEYVDISGIYLRNDGSYFSAGAVYETNAKKVEFEWKSYDLSTLKWSNINTWTTGNCITWKPTRGNYWLYVEAKTDTGETASKAIGVTANFGLQIKNNFTPIRGSGNSAVYPNTAQCQAAINQVGPLCTQDQKKSGVLACVTLAQFILESGYGGTDLAQEANNCFGMKISLSGNTWAGSTWDGVSTYGKYSPEDDGHGNITQEYSVFRKYACVEDSIADHSAYLTGAKNGSGLRYAGLVGEKDYVKAITIIKNGGYATDSTYIAQICRIIEQWNLTKYNA